MKNKNAKNKKKSTTQKKENSNKIITSDIKKEQNNNKRSIYTNILPVLLTFVLTILGCFIIFDPFKLFIKDDIINDTPALAEELEKPILNFYDGQSINKQDLQITWQECFSASSYLYRVRDLKGIPNKDEKDDLGAITLAENLIGTNDRVINIEKSRINEGKWIEISVASTNGKDQAWEKSYIYINLTGKAKNTKVDILATKAEPKIDGSLSNNEYGKKVHSTDYNNNEFVDFYDTDHSIKADFYMTWDKENIYIAWVLNAQEHFPIPADYNNDGKNATPADLQFMWRYSYLQFMLCTGAPDSKTKQYQTDIWWGNYLELGLSVMQDGSTAKMVWSKPKSDTKFDVDSCEVVGKRDDETKTTTYEVKVPWSSLGVNDVKENTSIGFTYALGDQQDYNVQPSIVEWQDAILGAKNMDNGAIITLKNNS